MAKAKRYWYEPLIPCDLGWYGPDQRKERWKSKGGVLIQPPHTKHSLRVNPSPGEDARGQVRPPDYVVTDRPLAKQFTEEVTKMVSRPKFDPNTGKRDGREMREKTSKVKFRLLDPDEVTDYVRRHAKDMEWSEDCFIDATADVYLPREMKKIDDAGMKAAGVKANASA